MKTAVIGAGAWGTALAIHFARCAHAVTLYARTEEDAAAIRAAGENSQFLPNFRLPENLHVQAMSADMADAELILVVTPTNALREVLRAWVAPYALQVPILAACKGFEQGTGLLPHQVLREMLPENTRVGLLSGPSFAQEVAQGLPSAVCLASDNAAWAEELAAALNSTVMRLYANHDPIGVAVGGAVKNVMAIASGVTDGLAYGLNARAALMTRGLAEITRLASALGAQASTMMGLAGMGDLILTCTGALSRNRQVGLKLAEGKPLPQILQELGHVAEGVNTVGEVVRMAQAHQVEMPITHVLHELLSGRITAGDAVQALMLREPKFE
ncbi:MAG: NAD(P)H-dependent glycerol-3-phosphate dehydrogenase [Neisseria sp.]|nr:NAD(P)H-dependent glycerol-3-phosphate dehydrogenase [Neisseria sp.]